MVLLTMPNWWVLGCSQSTGANIYLRTWVRTARHQHNREIKQAGLDLYLNGHFRTDDEAFQIIGAKLHRAPGTVKNWVLAAKKVRRNAA